MATVAAEQPGTYRFGAFRLDTMQRILEKEGALVPLPPKAVDTLIVLVERRGQVVDKTALLQTVWPDTFVVESSLSKNICLLRKTLDVPGQESVIQTVAKRGYRFIAPPETLQAGKAIAPEPKRSLRRWTVMALTALGLCLLFLTEQTSTRARTDSESERLYQIGRYIWSKFDRVEVNKALAQFEKAVEANPRSALAHAGIADALVLRVTLGAGRPDDLQRARTEAAKALELNPKLAAPHVSTGWVHVFAEFDMQAAEREFKRALVIDGEWAPAYLAYSCLLAHSGRIPEARRMISAAQRLDPVSAMYGVQAARIEYYDRKYERAATMLREVLDREPAFGEAHYYMAMTLGELGRTAAARDHLRQAQLHSNLLATDEAWLDAKEGRTESAMRLVSERKTPTTVLMPAITAGKTEIALTSMQQMARERRIELLTAKMSPRFDTLRGDPRFHAVLDQIWRQR